MRLPEMARLENPAPRPCACQARGGPSAGHCRSRPLAVERSSRCGPRQPGQSDSPDAPARTIHETHAQQARKYFARLDFMKLTDGHRQLELSFVRKGWPVWNGVISSRWPPFCPSRSERSPHSAFSLAKLHYPLLQRQATDLRNPHCPVQPVGGFAAKEVKVRSRLFQSGCMATFGQFCVDGL